MLTVSRAETRAKYNAVWQILQAFWLVEVTFRIKGISRSEDFKPVMYGL